MLQRLWIIGGFALLSFGLWFISMRLTPHRGILRVTETLCVGIILCYCLGLMLRPFGLFCPQGPVSAALAGTLGLPGAVLSFLVSNGI